jgi:hypothetical protein
VRFQDAARDGRAVVDAAIQADPLVRRAAAALADAPAGVRLLARAVMNGETTDADGWRTAFPSLFGEGVEPSIRGLAEEMLALSLAVAERGEQVRSQVRGAIVEALTAELLARRVPPDAVRRERRVHFAGVRADIHPFDVTVEAADRAEAWDCKWGARGISGEVLLQLETARANAEAEDERLAVGLVVFDARRSCAARLARETTTRTGTAIVTIESLDRLAGSPSARRPAAEPG